MNRRNPGYIARWRGAKNITQERFAAMLGISAGVLSGIENGRDPRWSNLVSIASAMDISEVELLYRIGFIEQHEKNASSRNNEETVK